MLASCEPPAVVEPLAQKHDAIMGGANAASDPQVFLIDLTFDNAVRTVCSATLIGQRTLVTAAHCVDPARQAGATSVSIKATNKMIASQASTSELIDIVETRLHPSWDPLAAKSSYDIALLLLATPATPAPREINRAGLSGFVGQPMRVVGYGRTDPSTSNSGTRRAVTVNVTSDDSDHVFFGASGSTGICAGDSGG
ncbi:MAG: S1 family peptidase, partial [Myxococcaceae bacterium]